MTENLTLYLFYAWFSTHWSLKGFDHSELTDQQVSSSVKKPGHGRLMHTRMRDAHIHTYKKMRILTWPIHTHTYIHTKKRVKIPALTDCMCMQMQTFTHIHTHNVFEKIQQNYCFDWRYVHVFAFTHTYYGKQTHTQALKHKARAMTRKLHTCTVDTPRIVAYCMCMYVQTYKPYIHTYRDVYVLQTVVPSSKVGVLPYTYTIVHAYIIYKHTHVHKSYTLTSTFIYNM